MADIAPGPLLMWSETASVLAVLAFQISTNGATIAFFGRSCVEDGKRTLVLARWLWPVHTQ